MVTGMGGSPSREGQEGLFLVPQMRHAYGSKEVEIQGKISFRVYSDCINRKAKVIDGLDVDSVRKTLGILKWGTGWIEVRRPGLGKRAGS